MTNADYNTLQCRIKALQGQVDRLISGKEYQKLREQHSKDVAYYCGEIDRLKKRSGSQPKGNYPGQGNLV